MKNFYIAVTVKQDRNERIFTERETEAIEWGLYSYVIKCTESDNLKAIFERVGGLVQANICQTKKQAQNNVDYWNTCYKANGTYLFDIPRF